jgi:hypothetical protein
MYMVLMGKPEVKRPIGRHRRKREVNTVTCIHIARQRLGKHITAQANSLNNRKYIGRQRICKHVSLTEAVFSVGSVQSGYKEVKSRRTESSSETSACQDMRIELSRVVGIGSCRPVAKKEPGSVKTSCVI